MAGKEEFGQLLVEGIKFPVLELEGYYSVKARLKKNSKPIADGFDEIFTVDYMNRTGSKSTISVIESDGLVKKFLQTSRNISAGSYQQGSDNSDVIIVGNHEPRSSDMNLVESVFERVSQGATVIVLENADFFAEKVNSKLRTRPRFYKGGGIIKRGNAGLQFVGYRRPETP